ncbi:MAG: DUF892 family protein [Chloroflexi bacterium]|nr:DUF892 family protein [Chloroflexota bacterium]
MPLPNPFYPLLLQELRDFYDAKQQAAQAYPHLEEAAADSALASLFDQHTHLTTEHLTRLEAVFSHLNAPTKQSACEAMRGIVQRAYAYISSLRPGPIRDGALVVTARKVEYYEIACAGMLSALAFQLDDSAPAQDFQTILIEDEIAKNDLMALAEGMSKFPQR